MKAGYLFSCAFLLGLVFGAEGQPLLLEASLSPAETPYHRFSILELCVEVPADHEIEFPTMAGEKGKMECTSLTSTTETIAEGRIRKIQRYKVDAIVPGIYYIPVSQVRWKNGQSEGTLVAPGLVFHARSLTESEKEAASQFVGITKPHDVLASRRSRWVFPGVVIFAVAIAIAIVVLWLLGRSKASPIKPPSPPWEVALNRLRELQQRDLLAAGKLEAFYVDLSSILRYYIEDRFHIKAPEQTTPEFLEAAVASGLFSEAQQEFLTGFLYQCDRVKFALLRPGMEEMEEHFKEVRRFVKETIPPELQETLLEQAA